MRALIFLVGFFMVSSTTHAADPVRPDTIGTWSNVGRGGGTLSIARYRMGFDEDRKIEADYKVCTAPGSDVATFFATEPQSDTKSIGPGQSCHCFKNPAVMAFRSGNGTPINGTYQVFKGGSGCIGKPMKVSSPIVEKLTCHRICDGNECAIGPHWHAVACDISLAAKRANYRVCTKPDSLVRENGTTHDLAYANIVTNPKLASRYPAGPSQQPLAEFAPLTGDCIDLFQVSQLSILVGPYPVTGLGSNSPYLINEVNITLQSLGQ